MSNLESHRICPICGQDNGCIIGNQNCWCTEYKFPEELINRVPKEKRKKVCICKNCVEEFKKEKDR